MAAEVLVVTAQASLGEKIRRGMSGYGEYNIQVTDDFAQLIKLVPQTGAVLVFLDSDIGDSNLSIVDIAFALRQLNANMEFVIVAPQGKFPEVGQINPRGIIHKPIEAVELNALMNELAGPAIKISSDPAQTAELPREVETAPLADSPQEFPWLQDINRAAQHLTRLTLESAAQAALMTRDNQLWAYAGQLSQEAAQELARTVQRYWDRESDSDLLRFVRLQATEQSHMLYATRLSPSLILVLVFDGETPFSTIRTQAGRLASSLSLSPSATQAVPPPTELKQDEGLFSFQAEAEDGEGQFFPSITDLLNDVPPPNPPGEAGVAESLRGIPAPSVFTNNDLSNLPRLSSLKNTVDNGNRPVDVAFDTQAPESQAETRPNDADMPPDLAATRKQVALPDPESLVETRPSTLIDTEGVQRIVVEPVSAALYNLNYACLLVPRFENHYLTGGLADVLGEWMPHVCIAFGWRLEHLAIRPEYLQWVVNVPPSISPGYLMRIVRQQTSERIFNDVPRLKKENPSGDFWAPGYLIMGGSQPHPPKLVKDFIKQTRQRQGVSPRTMY